MKVVVHPPGNRDYHYAYQSAAVGPSGQPDTENRLPRILFIVIAVLGLATYGVSFGPVINGSGATGWNVRFAALAALCAALGLLPRQKPLPLVTAVLAAMGFLDGLSSVVTGEGWALTVIVVLNALQAAAAVTALLVAPKPVTDRSSAGYEAYVDYYNQAVRNYYSQQARSSPEQSQSGYGQAYADPQTAPQRAQRPSQYGDYADLDYTGTRAPTAPEHQPGNTVSGRSAGLPSFGQAPTAAYQPHRDPEQSAPPSSPA
ncbi:MAG TPA: DUF5336 domain-containing protein [Mycobacterium sp.]|nr:DUF5336 domain-containing protein [Mycobacterium sp.]